MDLASPRSHRPQSVVRRAVAETAMGVTGLALLACALAADRRWVDRHFLPSFFAPPGEYVVAATVTRIGVAALGVTLAFVMRQRIGRFAARTSPGTLAADAARVALALALALGLGEAVLRRTGSRLAAQEAPVTQEPSRRRDQRLGWVFVPARTGRATVAGRAIEYAFDPAGYRVGRADQSVDPERPVVIFTGESIMVGQGLPWDETVPAQVETLLGVQSVNLAVNGYATDQAYLRLLTELPRFRRPVAIVSLFAPSLFDRNLDTDRPHLGAGMRWLPAEHRSRLAALASRLVPYRSNEAIERGVAVTRDVLRASVELARSRGATPLILLPEFVPESPTEEVLRHRILDDTMVPYVRVTLDPRWRIPQDQHPDARATRAIAVAVAERLRAP